jgi:hypothetical protein
VVERDCSCDSNCMLQKMNLIRAEIPCHTPWIPRDRSINLILDSAGGHGTRAAKEQYTRKLLENHNIIIKWQPPRSPELNVLDLGLWMSLQSAVEKKQRDQRRTQDALALSVQEAWRDLPVASINKVFSRIPVVCQLIVVEGGDNLRVEDQRGVMREPEQE